MSKVIIITLVFSDEEWAELKEFYSEREIREGLMCGAVAEMNALLENRQSNKVETERFNQYDKTDFSEE